MGTVLGLLLGAGVFCCWWACWPMAPKVGVRQPPRLIRLLADDLAQAGMPKVHPMAVLAASAGCGLLAGLTMLVISQTISIAGCFAIMAAAAPVLVVRRRARLRRRAAIALWPEAVDHLVSGVRAGLSLPAALAQLGEHGPEELRPAFAAFAHDYRTTARFNDCLDRLKERLSDPVADRIVEALRLTREVGGSDLGTMLRTLSAFLREEAATRSELEARQSWTVNGAKLAVAAPWLVLALMSTRPEAVTAYSRPGGYLVLGLGGAASVVAYLLMLRIGRLPQEPRVLR